MAHKEVLHRRGPDRKEGHLQTGVARKEAALAAFLESGSTCSWLAPHYAIGRCDPGVGFG